MQAPVQCTSCEHRFETIGAPGEHVDCPACGTELTLPIPTSMPPARAELGRIDLTITPEQIDAVQRERVLEQVAAEAREEPVAVSRNAPTLLPPPSPVPHVSPRLELMIDVTEHGKQRAAVALFVGAYVEAVLDGTTGAEVRIRRRGDSVQLVANRFIPGGRRVEDSQMVHERDLLGAAPLDAGRIRGEQVAAMIRVAVGEDRPE